MFRMRPEFSVSRIHTSLVLCVLINKPDIDFLISSMDGYKAV